VNSASKNKYVCEVCGTVVRYKGVLDNRHNEKCMFDTDPVKVRKNAKQAEWAYNNPPVRKPRKPTEKRQKKEPGVTTIRYSDYVKSLKQKQ
jgi:hypothetical protein